MGRFLPFMISKAAQPANLSVFTGCHGIQPDTCTSYGRIVLLEQRCAP